jgi:hypothetical protein
MLPQLGTGGGAMANGESPSMRYRRLAEEALDVAKNFPLGEHRDALLQMAQVWQRLSDSYADATTSLLTPIQREQPAMQQQQQIQPDDDKKE